jgi:hypothetical protein
LATPNYGYEKRQRELAKKKKKEEKLRSKASHARQGDSPDAQNGPSDDNPNISSPASGSGDAAQPA